MYKKPEQGQWGQHVFDPILTTATIRITHNNVEISFYSSLWVTIWSLSGCIGVHKRDNYLIVAYLPALHTETIVLRRRK